MVVEEGSASPAPGAFDAEVILLDQLHSFKDPLARLAWISRRGRDHSGLPVSQKIEANRVNGCLSQLWLVGTEDSGAWRFDCDSDSMIVRGLASLICEACGGRTSTELLQRRNHSPLLSDPALRSLTQSRRSGLTHLWNRMLTIVETAVSADPQVPG